MKTDLKIGLWYRVSSFSNVKEVKIYPSERLVENQDPKYKYFEVLTKDKDGWTTSRLNGTLEECQEYIFRNYAVDLEDGENISNIIEQLTEDVKSLRKSERNNYVDMSYRLEHLIDILKDNEWNIK